MTILETPTHEGHTLGNRLLLLVSERIGDVIFCTPAISLLHAGKPNATIDILALSEFSSQVFDHNPDINHLFVKPSKSIIKEIKENYDVIVDLHNSEETQRYVRWLNKPTFTSSRSGESHQSAVAIQFIQSLLNQPIIYHPEHYRLYPQAAHHQRAKTLLQQEGAQFASDEILVGCHMGNYKTAKLAKRFWRRDIYSKKTWPVKKFAELQKILYKQNPNLKLVLTGSPSERVLVESLYREIPNIIDLIGKTSVLELAALMSYFKVFLTGDTGPMHVAAATQVPIVALFGPTQLEKTGPRPQRNDHIIIKQNPLHELNVEAVKTALSRFL